LSASGDEKRSVDVNKALQAINIKTQTANITKNMAVAADQLSQINQNIDLLRTGPSKFTVTDTKTGETRQAVGSDIDKLKALKSDWLTYVKEGAAYVKAAPKVIKSLEEKTRETTTKRVTATQKTDSEEARKNLYTSEPTPTKNTPKEAYFKTPITQPRPSGTGFLNKLDETANTLYSQANFPTIDEQKQAIETYGISKARTMFKPQTATEAKARLGLAVIEPIIGGGREVLFPFAQSLGRGRPGTEGIRILGGLATPSAADMVAGYTLSKLGATTKGRAVLKKVNNYLTDIGDPFFPKLTASELDEIRQFEKIGLTDLRRTVQRNPEILNTVSEIVEYYEKNPASYAAGAAVIPEEVVIFRSIAKKIDWDVDDLVYFINKNDDLFADGSLISSILPSLSKEDAAKVLEETTSLPQDQIDNVIEQLRKAAPRTDLAEAQVSDQIPEEEQGFIIEQIPEQVPKLTPVQVPELTTAQELAQELPQGTVEETITEETLEPSPIIPFKLKTEKRRKLNLKLFNGPKIKYRVTLRYQDKTKQTRTVEARSHPEAIAKAEMGKNRSKTLKTVESERIQ